MCGDILKVVVLCASDLLKVLVVLTDVQAA